MRILILFIVMVMVPGWAIAAPEKQNVKDDAVVVRTENQSIFKGLLYKVWGRLRSFNPTAISSRNRNRSVVTAGVRGAETTTSLIQPYWKDDQTGDPEYIKQLQEYTRAQQLAEGGDLQAAIRSLSAFIDTYQDSDLKPNAQFALGLSYGGIGNRQSGVATLEQFLSDNPKHPLAADAKQVIAELR